MITERNKQVASARETRRGRRGRHLAEDEKLMHALRRAVDAVVHGPEHHCRSGGRRPWEVHLLKQHSPERDTVEDAERQEAIAVQKHLFVVLFLFLFSFVFVIRFLLFVGDAVLIRFSISDLLETERSDALAGRVVKICSFRRRTLSELYRCFRRRTRIILNGGW